MRVYLAAAALFVSAIVVALVLVVLLFVLNEWVERLFSSNDVDPPKVDVDVESIDHALGLVTISIENEEKTENTITCRIEIKGLSPSQLVVQLGLDTHANRVLEIPAGQRADNFSITPNCTWD